MKKVFRKIHLWLSVPFGLLITLICFSGAMLVFETEVMELCHRDLYYVEKVGPAPLPMGKVAEKVAATLPDSVSVTGVTASSAPERAWQVNLSKPRRASVYVDQYTGEIKGKYERAPFFMPDGAGTSPAPPFSFPAPQQKAGIPGEAKEDILSVPAGGSSHYGARGRSLWRKAPSPLDPHPKHGGRHLTPSRRYDSRP